MQGEKHLKVTYLSEENFKGFGQIISIPDESSRVPTLESSFFKFYGGLGLMDCDDVVEIGVCTFKKRELETEELEQHAKTPEFLFAIDGDFIMPVAPITYKNDEAFPDLDRALALRVRQGEGVIFDDGIWHWAPFPIKDISSVLVGFKNGTAENDLVIKELDSKIIMNIGE